MKKVIVPVIAVLLLAGAVLAYLVYDGVLLLNNPSLEEYPVRGVDVSSYQGEIDWDVLAEHGIRFAFIKATEGSSHVDLYAQKNMREAGKTGLAVGCYHFFSYDSTGKAQAEHFISVVPKEAVALPPVADVEFYGDKENNPPEKSDVQRELTVFLETLEEHYGRKPVIYVTEKSYEMFLAGGFEEYDIWVRNVITAPALADERDWTFWQYTNRAVLSGYQGEEKFIDLNVFAGTEKQFEVYIEQGGTV